MAVVPYALTTLARAKLLLGITDTSKDALLEALINAVTDFIETFCGRRFKEPTNDFVEIVDGSGGKNISVRNYPITYFAKLERRLSDNTFENVDATTFYRDDANGLIIFFGNINTDRGVANYRATYKGGFSTIPNDLNLACVQLVVREFNQRQGAGDIKSERLGDYNVTYRAGAQESDTFIDETLSRYKKPRI
jgi:hypothetical protein